MGWVEQELAGADLGDKRRTDRLIKLTGDLAAQPSASIPVACQGWQETKAAYRLLDNPAVEWKEILGAHTENTKERILGHQVVLCLSDTTELDFTSQPGIAGLGRLSYEAQHGMYMHPMLMVTPQGSALGVVDAWMWARKPKGEAKFKESIRWIEGYHRVADLAEEVEGTRLVYVTDREGDIRDVMDAAQQRNFVADFLLRAQHARNTAAGNKLWECVERSEPLGKVEFTMPAAPGREARLVCQTLYAQRITLPKRKDKPELEVTAILAREENPPKGAQAVTWKLLTNRTATTLEEVVELIEWYRRRWLIEIFFRILKSGCKVESLQLGEMERLERALAIYLIIAWRILHLVTWGRECPDLACDAVFDTEEWHAAWIVSKHTKPPETPPKLNEMVLIVAGFGGFLGRKHDGQPGANVLWKGLQRVREFFIGIEAGRAAYAGAG